MRPDLFLVAHISAGAASDDLAWILRDGPPFEETDLVDFLLGPDVGRVFDLYKSVYQGLDFKLNAPTPKELMEYNRWVLIVEGDGTITAFACFKTTTWGLKLGMTATDGSTQSKASVKQLLSRVLVLDGAYGEISGAVERALAGKVPEIPPSVAALILGEGKATRQDPDGRHYWRNITNVGEKKKLMVGKPSGLALLTPNFA